MQISDTSHCEGCKFCVVNEINKAKILMYCELDEKERIYGAAFICDRKEELKCSEE